MILFLDFDGVLHPEGEDHIYNGGVDFCFLPRLEALLREFPFVKIVISSQRVRHCMKDYSQFITKSHWVRVFPSAGPSRSGINQCLL